MTLITPEAETLFAIARYLDRLPLTTEQRAEVFHAWEAAPDEPILTWPHPDADDQAFDRYCESPAGRVWHRVRQFRLRRPSAAYATDLDEASGHESAPTKTEIIRALINAEHLLDPSTNTKENS